MYDLRLDDALQRQIETAVDVLANGGVVGIPTDTLYGLAACAFNESAVRKVFELKGRPDGMALPLLLSEAEDAKKCAEEVPLDAMTLAEHFWPGALTLVLRKGAEVPYAVTAGLDTVALRVPDHPVPRAVSRALGCADHGNEREPERQARADERGGSEGRIRRCDRLRAGLGRCAGRRGIDYTGLVRRRDASASGGCGFEGGD